MALLILLTACILKGECDDRVEAAVALARAHAPDCTFDPDALAEPSCGGDDSPELTYLSVWCGEAPLDCILGDTALERTCFGEP